MEPFVATWKSFGETEEGTVLQFIISPNDNECYAIVLHDSRPKSVPYRDLRFVRWLNP